MGNLSAFRDADGRWAVEALSRYPKPTGRYRVPADSISVSTTKNNKAIVGPAMWLLMCFLCIDFPPHDWKEVNDFITLFQGFFGVCCLVTQVSDLDHRITLLWSRK